MKQDDVFKFFPTDATKTIKNRSEEATAQRWSDEIDIRSSNTSISRLAFVVIIFFAVFVTISIKMNLVAYSDYADGNTSKDVLIFKNRPDITDVDGRILATNIDTFAVYAHPHEMIDPIYAVDKLIEIFPNKKNIREKMLAEFTGERKFVWVQKSISPEQMQAVHDIGEPGLLFAPRQRRLYPNGSIAAHVLGGTSFGREQVSSAENIGVAGLEKYIDKNKQYATSEEKIKTSIDLKVQYAIEKILLDSIDIFGAKGASATLMDIHTGKIVSLVSLPDFDPNFRPISKSRDGSDPLFNRSVQGIYEFGSVFKIFAAAQAIELGLANPDTIIDTNPPLRVGGFNIREFRGKNYKKISLTDVIVNSSNRGTARLALMIQPDRQRLFLKSLGLFDTQKLELIESSSVRPQFQRKWGDLVSVTASYGHGFATSQVHVASAYAAIANGGFIMTPSLLENSPIEKRRVFSKETAQKSLLILQKVVTEGTATFAQDLDYQIAGKTGTADKVNPAGGYFKDRVLATFAGVFPANNPKYSIVVSLDEPAIKIAERQQRSAGFTAVPVTAEIVSRIGPLLGLLPDPAL
jgi:cell division protein FtsI (penicillin-binding protein 3)